MSSEDVSDPAGLDLKVIATGVRFNIFEKNFPKIKSQLLQSMLESKLPLQFKNFKFVQDKEVCDEENCRETHGWIEIDCINKETVDWILKQEIYQSSHSQVYENQVIFYRPNETYTPITVEIPYYYDRNDKSLWKTWRIILKQIETQNPGIPTKDWIYIKDRFNSTGELYLFEVKNETLKYLETHEWKLYCGLETCVVELYDKKKQQQIFKDKKIILFSDKIKKINKHIQNSQQREQ